MGGDDRRSKSAFAAAALSAYVGIVAGRASAQLSNVAVARTPRRLRARSSEAITQRAEARNLGFREDVAKLFHSSSSMPSDADADADADVAKQQIGMNADVSRH